MQNVKLLHGTKSESNSNAQYSVLLTGNSQAEQRFNAVVHLLEHNSTLAVEVKAVIELMLYSGCRISQALSITSTDILLNGTIRIRGNKRSDDVITRCILFKEFWINNRIYINSILSNYNRFFFYRLFKKYGITFKLPHKTNYNVTHSLRQLFIDSLNVNDVSCELIKKSVGHKNVKSQEYYKSKK